MLGASVAAVAKKDLLKRKRAQNATHSRAKGTGEVCILPVPGHEGLCKLAIPVLGIIVDVVVVELVCVDLLELSDALLELHLLGEDPLAKGARLLELLLLGVEEGLEMVLHVGGGGEGGGDYGVEAIR